MEIVFALFGFADAPGKFADADDVDAGLGHQFGVMFPSALGIVGGAAVREDPLLRIIINAKKHNLASGFSRILKATRRACNLKITGVARDKTTDRSYLPNRLPSPLMMLLTAGARVVAGAFQHASRILADVGAGLADGFHGGGRDGVEAHCGSNRLR